METDVLEDNDPINLQNEVQTKVPIRKGNVIE